jgi:hypothetical protein
MAVTYQQLLHSVALRANALVGSQAGTLETTYATTTLTNTNFKSADFPFTSFRDAILQAEQDFVSAVAFTGQHPFRRSIRGVTANLAHNAVLPATSSTGKPIVGIFGSVYDASDSTPLVEMPIDVIVRRVRNANTNYVCPVYYYKFDGEIIRHTRTNVVIECCIYLRSDQVTAYDAAGNMLLPDVCEPGITARALSFLFRDGAYIEQAAVWRQYSDEALTAIRAGSTNVAPRSIPVPITQTRAG